MTNSHRNITQKVEIAKGRFGPITLGLKAAAIESGFNVSQSQKLPTTIVD